MKNYLFRLMFQFLLFPLFFVLINSNPLGAQIPTCADIGFGQNGISTLDIGGLYEQGSAIGYQSDGKMVIAGVGWNITNYFFFLQRLFPNGKVDSSFANKGTWIEISKFLDRKINLLVLPNNEIIVSGVPYFNNKKANVLFKFSSNGKLDTTFGINGHYKIPLPYDYNPESTHLVPLKNNKFLALCRVNDLFSIIRFNSDCSIDSLFGNNGLVIHLSGFSSVSINIAIADSSDGFWIGGSIDYPNKYYIQKFKSDGSVDLSFANKGIMSGNYQTAGSGSSRINDILVSKNDNVIFLGEFDSKFLDYKLAVLSKLSPNGSPDLTFGKAGISIDTFFVTKGSLNDLYKLPDNNLLISGRLENKMSFIKYSQTGQRLTKYGIQGINNVPYGPTGYNEASYLLWNPIVQRTFVLGYTNSSYPEIYYDGFSSIEAEDIDISLTCLDSLGYLDLNYGYYGKSTSHVISDTELAQAIDFQEDGKAILALNISGQATFLIRVLQDGSIDRSFGNFGKINLRNYTLGYNFNSPPYGSLLVYNNKILVVGNRNPDGGSVLRLLSNGVPDSTFGKSGHASFSDSNGGGLSSPSSVNILNGKILVAGSSTYGSPSDFLFAQYLEDGSYDMNFGTKGIVQINIKEKDLIIHLKVRKNGKILALGYSEDKTLNRYFSGLQLNSNGSIDTSFGKKGILILDNLKYGGIYPSSVILLNNNKILATCNSNVVAVQLLQNGALDSTFSKNGVLDDFEQKVPVFSDAYTSAYNGNELIIGGNGYEGFISLANLSNEGALSNPCTGGGQFIKTDLFPNDDERIENIIKYDYTNNLWVFGTKNNRLLDNKVFLMRLNTIVTSSNDLRKPNEFLEIYPNPAMNFIDLNINNESINEARYEIRNIFGDAMESNRILESNQRIELGSYPSGIYFINVFSNSLHISQKFIKI